MFGSRYINIVGPFTQVIENYCPYRKKRQGYFFYIFGKFFGYQSLTSILGIFMVFVLTAIMSTTGRLILTIGMMISWDLYNYVRKAEHYGKASNPPIKDDSFPVGNQHYDPSLPALSDGNQDYGSNLCHTFRRFVLGGYLRRLSPYKRQDVSFSHYWYSVP